MLNCVKLETNRFINHTKQWFYNNQQIIYQYESIGNKQLDLFDKSLITNVIDCERKIPLYVEKPIIN
jgi:hypothetical protein